MENKDSISKAASDLKKSASNIATDVKNAASEINEDIKDKATETFANAKDNLLASATNARDSWEKITPEIDELKVKAQELASRGVEFCASCSAQAKQHLAKTSEAAVQYVTDKPVKSVLIAALTGATIAAALISRNRKH